MDWRDKWIDHVGAALVSTALSFALTMMLCQSMALTASAWTLSLTCLATCAICAIGATSKKGAMVALALAGGLIAFLCLSPVKLIQSVASLFTQLASLYTGNEASIAEFTSTISIVLGVALSLFLFWLTDMDGGVYPALALSVVILMCIWLLGRSIDSLYSFIAVSALVCMFARASTDGAKYVRAIPAALIAVALAVTFVPSGNPTFEPFALAAQKVRDMFNDYFFFTDPRTTYSISSDGFQPMGEMLGGPADPNLGNIMIVETDDTLFLRGSVKRTYTTYAWTESAINSRYVFIDPLRKSVRDDVFDVDKTATADALRAFKRVKPLVTVVSDGISTLFVPHRLVDLDIPLDIATYFSTSGEVFITRGVRPGDSYTIDAYIESGDSNALRKAVTSASNAVDAEYESVRQAYTLLPSGIDKEVYALAQNVTKNALTPYDKAIALEKHLLDNYTYSLSVKYPPRNKDFVSNFLLKTKKGYCSYFASAMAVMARMVGLPSRYVEGYMVPARASGTTLVTGKNAHAWVEIYFSGIGWLTFNPTPGSGDDYDASSDAGRPGDDGETDTDESDEEDDQTSANPTPTPDPEAGSDNTDEDGGEEPSSDSEDQSEPDEAQQEDQTPDQDEDEETQDESESTPPQSDKPNLWWLIILLPLAALCAVLVRRLRKSNPAIFTGSLKSTEDKLLTWYRAILLALEYQGQTPTPAETPTQFAERLVKQRLADSSLVALTGQISLSRYAGRRPDAMVLRQARKAYALVVRQLRPIERVRWYLHRIVKGIGDTKNIP